MVEVGVVEVLSVVIASTAGGLLVWGGLRKVRSPRGEGILGRRLEQPAGLAEIALGAGTLIALQVSGPPRQVAMLTLGGLYSVYGGVQVRLSSANASCGCLRNRERAAISSAIRNVVLAGGAIGAAFASPLPLGAALATMALGLAAAVVVVASAPSESTGVERALAWR